MKKYIICFILVAACTQKSDTITVDYKQKHILNRNDTLEIPITLRNQLEEDYFRLSPRPVERTDTQKKVLLGTLTRDFLPFSVALMDRQGVLKHESTLFKMDGGGQVDLAQYLNGKEGEFVVQFILDERFKSSNTRVYFLNNLKAQTCDDFRDITRFFFSTMANKGLVTTTKDLVHLKLLVGAVVILSNIEDRYYMGQLNITDSRAKEALCR